VAEKTGSAAEGVAEKEVMGLVVKSRKEKRGRGDVVRVASCEKETRG